MAIAGPRSSPKTRTFRGAKCHVNCLVAAKELIEITIVGRFSKQHGI